jgi:hypothetical protein
VELEHPAASRAARVRLDSRRRVIRDVVMEASIGRGTTEPKLCFVSVRAR